MALSAKETNSRQRKPITMLSLRKLVPRYKSSTWPTRTKLRIVIFLKKSLFIASHFVAEVSALRLPPKAQIAISPAMKSHIITTNKASTPESQPPKIAQIPPPVMPRRPAIVFFRESIELSLPLLVHIKVNLKVHL